MEKIVLRKTIKEKKLVRYCFDYTEGLNKYFSGNDFEIEYPIEVDKIPDSVLNIPFVACLIHIVWLTHSVLDVPIIDFDFFNSLPKLKEAYSNMFGGNIFLGNIIA